MPGTNGLSLPQVVKDQITLTASIYGLSGGDDLHHVLPQGRARTGGHLDRAARDLGRLLRICDDILSKTGATPAGIPAARPWGGGTWEEGFRHVWLGFAESNQIYDPSDGKWVVSSDGLLKALQVYETLAKNKWLTGRGCCSRRIPGSRSSIRASSRARSSWRPAATGSGSSTGVPKARTRLTTSSTRWIAGCSRRPLASRSPMRRQAAPLPSPRQPRTSPARSSLSKPVSHAGRHLQGARNLLRRAVAAQRFRR